jgi:hypothetical protein
LNSGYTSARFVFTAKITGMYSLRFEVEVKHSHAPIPLKFRAYHLEDASAGTSPAIPARFGIGADSTLAMESNIAAYFSFKTPAGPRQGYLVKLTPARSSGFCHFNLYSGGSCSQINCLNGDVVGEFDSGGSGGSVAFWAGFLPGESEFVVQTSMLCSSYPCATKVVASLEKVQGLLPEDALPVEVDGPSVKPAKFSRRWFVFSTTSTLLNYCVIIEDQKDILPTLTAYSGCGSSSADCVEIGRTESKGGGVIHGNSWSDTISLKGPEEADGRVWLHVDFDGSIVPTVSVRSCNATLFGLSTAISIIIVVVVILLFCLVCKKCPLYRLKARRSERKDGGFDNRSAAVEEVHLLEVAEEEGEK